VFIFPGMGLAVITLGVREVTDDMFLAAANALADAMKPEQLAVGQIYPSIEDVQEVSRSVAIAVGAQAIREGVADDVDDLEEAIDAERWEPEYIPFRPAGD
jgi:malate dehydrogenase (oxaloacetate-decarboxylating)